MIYSMSSLRDYYNEYLYYYNHVIPSGLIEFSVEAD